MRAERPVDYDACMRAPFGRLGIRVSNGFVQLIEYLPPDGPVFGGTDALTREACAQLDAYLREPTFRFDLPLRPVGTPFRQRVWDALCDIPVGTTLTYGELARVLGTSARSVGGACGANPVPPVVPCHRVVGTGGLGGFMGSMSGHPMVVKKWLLAHEGVLR